MTKLQLLGTLAVPVFGNATFGHRQHSPTKGELIPRQFAGSCALSEHCFNFILELSAPLSKVKLWIKTGTARENHERFRRAIIDTELLLIERDTHLPHHANYARTNCTIVIFRARGRVEDALLKLEKVSIEIFESLLDGHVGSTPLKGEHPSKFGVSEPQNLTCGKTLYHGFPGNDFLDSTTLLKIINY